MQNNKHEVAEIMSSEVKKRRRVYSIKMESGVIYEDVVCDSSVYASLNIDSKLTSKFFKEKS